MNMLRQKTNDLQKHHSFRWLEGLLLAVVLCVAALRLSFIEMPQNNMQNAALWTTPRGISLILSSVIFVVAMLGFLLQVLQGRWKLGVVMIAGWILFALATAISAGFAASDKRTAITEGFTLVVPMLAAMVLFGWLDSPRRTAVVLWMMLSMGCAAVYVSVDQVLDSNQKVVEDYQRDPQRHLQMLGIEPNSLAQFQYEHRLRSKDVRGFLTTSNSTATFLLTGVFIAAGLVMNAFRNRKNDPGFAARLVVLMLVLLTLLSGLFIVKSRGALAAGGLSAVLFIVLVCFGRPFWRYRRLILVVLLLAFVGVWAAAITYGIKNDRLPGPNAMYVRWQYWVGAAKMAAQHPLGVGGGNFGIFYPQYKIPAAPETVRDPHNFVLSLLCQFGPLGLLGFLLMVFAALWRGLKNCVKNHTVANLSDKPDKIIPFGALAGITAALLLVRPFVSEGGILGPTPIIRQSVFVVMYLLPAFFFVCPFGLLWATGTDPTIVSRREGLTTGLICAIIGVLIHNLIDFALLEPGVWTVFWLLMALLMAMGDSQGTVVSSKKPARFFVAAGMFLVVAGALYSCIWVPVLAGREFQKALGNYDSPQEYFQQAAQIDSFDPEPWLYAAQWSLNRSRIVSSPIKREEYLTQALTFLQQAQHRNPHNYAYSESLSKVYVYESGVKKENGRKFLEAAYQAEMEAQCLYPGSDRIAFELGILAEEMEQSPKAVEHFRRAIEIEDQYRKQFAEMYPDYPLCSRLGQKRYEYAKEYVQKGHQPNGFQY